MKNLIATTTTIHAGDGGAEEEGGIREKYLSVNYHVKFGHFSGNYHVGLKFGNFVIFSVKYHQIRAFFFNFLGKYHYNSGILLRRH